MIIDIKILLSILNASFNHIWTHSMLFLNLLISKFADLLFRSNCEFLNFSADNCCCVKFSFFSKFFSLSSISALAILNTGYFTQSFNLGMYTKLKAVLNFNNFLWWISEITLYRTQSTNVCRWENFNTIIFKIWFLQCTM